MGAWAKSLFGREEFDSIGVIIAGTISIRREKAVLELGDELISSHDAAYHGHIIRIGERIVPIVTNVYGAPAMVDLLTEMYDGGCRTVIFIGSAYGFPPADVGMVTIPRQCYHFDGIYHPVVPDKVSSKPDKELVQKVKNIFKKEKVLFSEGPNISVPAVTLQPLHANEHYKKIKPYTLEMELAACFSRGKDLGMRTAGILVVSDTRSSKIRDLVKKEMRNEKLYQAIKICLKNIHHFECSPLKTKKSFNIDEHLAAIVHDPEDRTNVYRKK